MAKLKKSEKRLLTIFALVLIGLVTYFVLDFILRERKQLKEREVALQNEKRELQAMFERRGEWSQIRSWLNANQPRVRPDVEPENEVGDIILSSLKREELEEVDRQIRARDENPHFLAVATDVTVKGELEPIIRWLHLLPDQKDFRALTKCEILADKKDPKLIKCIVRLERWYNNQP